MGILKGRILHYITEAKLMSKTTFGTLTRNGVVKSMEIDLHTIDSPDPLAYAYGYHQAISGMPMSKEKGLASEYVRGYKDGLKKKKIKLKRRT